MITADNLITKCHRNIPDIGGRVESEDWYHAFTEAIREIRRGRTFPWQRRTVSFEFFTDVFEYALPSDFDSFIKPHEGMLESTDEGTYLLYGRDKDFFANSNYGLALSWDRATRLLLARQDGEADVLMDGFGDDSTEYTLAGDASNAVSDDVYFKEGEASLRFDITASAGYSDVSRTIESPLDLTEYLNKGYAFLWVYMPTVLSSVTLRYGSDASNYYEIASITTTALGSSFGTGWNLIKFTLDDAVSTGSPDITAIDYYLVRLNHSSVTDTDFRIDGLNFRLPSIFDFPYNSKHVVTSSTGTYQESVTAGSDNILGDDTFEAVIMWKAVEWAGAFPLRDIDLRDMANAEYKKAIVDFNRNYPSTQALLQSNYYRRFKDI